MHDSHSKNYSINNKFMCNKVTCEKEKFWESEKGEIIDQATKTITAECKAKGQ